MASFYQCCPAFWGTYRRCLRPADSGACLSDLAWAGARQGAALGKQTAAASLGQVVGSVAGGWLFAALLAFGAVVSLRISKALKEVSK